MHEQCQRCLTPASQNTYNARHCQQTALWSCVSDICMQLYDVSLQSPAAYLKANDAFHCRSAAAMGALRRLSGSPQMGHSHSAAPSVRLHGPAHLAGLRIQVSRQYQHVSSHPQSSAHVASVTLPAKLLHLFGTVFLIQHGLERHCLAVVYPIFTSLPVQLGHGVAMGCLFSSATSHTFTYNCCQSCYTQLFGHS